MACLLEFESNSVNELPNIYTNDRLSLLWMWLRH